MSTNKTYEEEMKTDLLTKKQRVEFLKRLESINFMPFTDPDEERRKARNRRKKRNRKH